MGDTINLQCAFDAATGHGSEVHLIRGTYRTAQIVVNNFDGRFTGAGKDKTLIVNLPNLVVTQTDMNYPDAPSAANSWPSLFSFVNGNIYMADLAIHITGIPTTGWSIFGMDPMKDLAIGIVFLGTKTDAYVENILLEGEKMQGSLQGYNLINGVFYEGFLGNPWVPNSGSFQVHHSTFRNLDSGTPITNLYQATVVISHNTYEDVIYAMDGGGLVKSSLEFSNNDVTVVNGSFLGGDVVLGEGMYLYPFGPVTEDIDSTFLIRNNTFSGTNGPRFDMVLGTGNHCLIKGNSLQNGLVITLGTGSQECVVKK